jgi:hypothetical protein
MLTTLVCLVTLLGQSHPQSIHLVYTEADTDALIEDLHLVNPTHAQLQREACAHLQLAIEVANEE